MNGKGTLAYEGARAAFDDICRIAARATKSEIVCIVSNEDDVRAIIRGSVGTNATVLEGTSTIPGLDRRSLMVWPKLAEAPWFENHALAAIASFASSLIVVQIEEHESIQTTYLALFNPKPSHLKDTASLALLSELSRVARTIIATDRHLNRVEETIFKSPETNRHTTPLGLQETPAIPIPTPKEPLHSAADVSNDSVDPLTQFLMKSLVVRRSLKARNGHSYITIRSWRQASKETQIDALRAIKLERSARAVRAIATEIAAAVRDLYPGIPLSAVVPVPCGHSGHDACLSALLAAEVARILSVPYATPLRGTLKKGSSHPKENVRLASYKVVEAVSGTVLLIDDVATSGIHMANAMAALKKKGAAPLAIAWIGG